MTTDLIALKTKLQSLENIHLQLHLGTELYKDELYGGFDIKTFLEYRKMWGATSAIIWNTHYCIPLTFKNQFNTNYIFNIELDDDREAVEAFIEIYPYVSIHTYDKHYLKYVNEDTRTRVALALIEEHRGFTRVFSRREETTNLEWADYLNQDLLDIDIKNNQRIIP